jgi:predicted transcriptional regulator
MDFVKEIKVFCAEHGLKPSALMVRAGVSTSTWQGWQRGNSPLLHNVEKVRRAMQGVRDELAGV